MVVVFTDFLLSVVVANGGATVVRLPCWLRM